MMSACRAVSLMRKSMATICFTFGHRCSSSRVLLRLWRRTLPKIDTITCGACPGAGITGNHFFSTASRK